MISSEFTCKCGQAKGWVVDGETMKKPCPHCGRKYAGKYNSETLTIDAIEVSKEGEKSSE